MISFPSSGGKVRGENLVGEEINTKLENLFRVFKLTFTEGKALVNLSNSPDESMSYSLMDIINKETKGGHTAHRALGSFHLGLGVFVWALDVDESGGWRGEDCLRWKRLTRKLSVNLLK